MALGTARRGYRARKLSVNSNNTEKRNMGQANGTPESSHSNTAPSLLGAVIDAANEQWGLSRYILENDVARHAQGKYAVYLTHEQILGLMDA